MFVGRTRELDELRAGLFAARSGRGGLFLVSGEGGVGKTRLVAELERAAADAGVPTLWGRSGSDAGGGPAFWPWIQIGRDYIKAMGAETLATNFDMFAPLLTELLPDVSALQRTIPDTTTVLSSEAMRFQLFDAVAQFVCNQEPFLAVLDDIHFADMPSLRLLEYIAPRLVDSRLLLVATHRESDVSDEVHQLIASAGRAGHSIPLRGLDEPAVGTLVRDGFGVDVSDDAVTSITSSTDGNPYFIDEIVRLLIAEDRLADLGGSRLPVPPTVRATILRRLSGLDGESRTVFRAAATIGRSFDVAVLERAVSVPRTRLLDILATGMANGILVETTVSEPVMRFSHSLMREAIFDDIPRAERPQWHLQIVHALEAFSTDDRRSEIAFHALEAAPLLGVDPAAKRALDAGRTAIASLGFEDATYYFSRAVDLIEREGSDDTRRYCEALLLLGLSRRCEGDPDASFTLFDRAFDIAVELDEPHMIADAAFGYEEARTAAGRFGEVGPAIRRLRFALDHVPDEDFVLRSVMLGRLAIALHFVASPEETIPLAREAVAMAEDLEDEAVYVNALIALRWALLEPEHLEERVHLSSEIERVARNANLPNEAHVGHSGFILDLIEAGQLTRAHVESARWAVDPLLSKSVRSSWWPAIYAATRALCVGAFEDGERALAAVQGTWWPSAAAAWLALALALELGEPDRIDSAFDALLAKTSFRRSHHAMLEAFIDFEAGRERRGSARYAALGIRPGDLHNDSTIVWTMPMLGLLAGRCGDVDVAAAVYDRLLPYGDRIITVMLGTFLGPQSLCLGVMARALGRDDEAIAHFEATLQHAERDGAASWVPRAELEIARTIVERDAPRAAQLAQRAVVGADALGMRGVARSARALLDAVLPAETPAIAVTAAAATIRPEGDYWTVEYGGSIARVRDSKGIRWLRELLLAPKREFHALDLSTALAAAPVDAAAAAEAGLKAPSGAGPLLDERARAAYRQRASDLQEEIEEAERWSDPERAARARAELDALADELSRAVGLGGRVRTAGDPSERARVNVTRAIRRSIDAITAAHPQLGEHLTVSVRTGTFCSYRPDPANPVSWSD